MKTVTVNVDELEDFERWADGVGLFIDGGGTKGYPSMATQGAWLAWQHLYPMVEAAYTEGWIDGVSAAYCVSVSRVVAKEEWNNSTAKVRLEGKDE